MLFCSVAFSIAVVPVKKFILYVTHPVAISLLKPCAAPCWSLTAVRRVAFSFVPWIPGPVHNSAFLYRGTAMSPTGCPSTELQPAESSPSGCSVSGSDCSWWLSPADIATLASLLPVLPEFASLPHFLPFPKPLWKAWGNVALSIHLLSDLPLVCASTCL